jgi:O-antigen/teichoic acid export membrane protein
MLPEFGKKNLFRENLRKLRHKSMRLMNSLFPLSIVIMLFSRWLYVHIFTPAFIRSADVFMIYLLLIIPRLVFPQTILIGEKKTRVVLLASTIGIIANVLLSLYLLQFYNVVGIALATVVVFIFEKALLVLYLYLKEGISPKEYIPVKHLLIYSVLIIIEFVLIDHRIINLV